MAKGWIVTCCLLHFADRAKGESVGQVETAGGNRHLPPWQGPFFSVEITSR